MINHQSTADVPVLMSIVSHSSKGTLARHVNYIMDVMFRYFPFGWVGLMHGDFFIRQVCVHENKCEYLMLVVIVLFRDVPDFGSGFGRSGIQPFLTNRPSPAPVR